MFLLKLGSELQNLVKEFALQYENINKLQTTSPRSRMHTPSYIRHKKSDYIKRIPHYWCFIGIFEKFFKGGFCKTPLNGRVCFVVPEKFHEGHYQ